MYKQQINYKTHITTLMKTLEYGFVSKLLYTILRIKPYLVKRTPHPHVFSPPYKCKTQQNYFERYNYMSTFPLYFIIVLPEFH